MTAALEPEPVTGSGTRAAPRSARLPGGATSRFPLPAPGLSPLEAVRARYASMYAAATEHTAATGADVPWPGAQGPLPPYLCRLLNRGELLGPAAHGPHAVLGTGSDPLVPVGTGPLRLRYATSIAPHLLRTIGSSGFRVVTPGPKTAARLAEAAATLPGLLPEAAAAVESYISVLVLLKPYRPARPMGETVASCAFPGLPFTAFLTGLGLHHLVPGFMFAQPCVYSLQESLYHEALRLALYEEERLADHFASPEARAALVYVSWQSEWRPAEQCLRMLYVYAHLARLRTAALRRGAGPDGGVLAEALRSVLACARELARDLAGRQRLFSGAGRELLDAVEELLLAGGVAVRS